MDYPKREAFFAHRFARLLTKTAAAMEIGSEACWLLTVIAFQEDACRYTKPVSFWNSQLVTLMGLPAHKEAVMRRAREKAISCGWLIHEAGAKGKAGRYFVTIPTYANTIGDGPSDESEESFRHNNDIYPTDKRQISDREATDNRQISDNILTSPLPIPGGEGNATAAAKKAHNRRELKKILLSSGCPAGEREMEEWKLVIEEVLTGKGLSAESKLNGVAHVLLKAKESGSPIRYAREAGDGLKSWASRNGKDAA